MITSEYKLILMFVILLWPYTAVATDEYIEEPQCWCTPYLQDGQVEPDILLSPTPEPPEIVTEQNKDTESIILKFNFLHEMKSSIVLIYDEDEGKILYSKNADVVASIASITKLMTAMIVLDAKLSMDKKIKLVKQDVNRKKHTRSRTKVGMILTRSELLKLSLMSSDNLSAAALARTFPGGVNAALVKMNQKARKLGMTSTQFIDSTGLSSGNVSTASDLAIMMRAAREYNLIQLFTTSTSYSVARDKRKRIQFHNTNPLVKNTSWNIALSKTGYINEAGYCLVMEADITDRTFIIIMLDAHGRNSRVEDAILVKKWIEGHSQVDKIEVDTELE